MKGVILGGGGGTRLKPLTSVTNKHLLPVYDQPMVYYPIKTLVDAGINEILIVTGGTFAGHYVHVLKNGKQWGIKHLEYAYQEENGGISHAIALAEDFADEDPITVILGDNTTDADISQAVKEFQSGAKIFIKKVPDPERFGVPRFDPQNPKKVVEILEKPDNPPSEFAVTGLYIYDQTVFDRIHALKPSARGELEVTDLNNSYIKDNKLTWAELDGFWSDAGTFDSLFRSNQFWAQKKKQHES
jgi:glucose-1-phosphate thymidylyltransferase